MEEIPDPLKEQFAELDQRMAQLKAYLASHPQRPAPKPSPDGRPASRWNVISFLAPFFGIVAAFGSASGSGGYGGDPLSLHGLVVFILAFLASTLFGFVAALVADYRNEQRRGLTTAGMLLNGLPALWLILQIFAH